MILQSLQLQQFRSYKKQEILFSPAITLIRGPNASGKTNILEAIFSLSTGKSFRAEKDSDMIAWNQELSRVKARVLDETSKELIVQELVLTHGMVQNQKTQSKRFSVNGIPRRLVDFVGTIKTVHFCPEDIDLVTDSPSLRREFLNHVLSQVDREYRRNLLSYERGLRQRNKLLDRIQEGFATRSQLVFWDQLLIKAGTYITNARQNFIEDINKGAIDDLHYYIVYDVSIISEARLFQYKEEELAAKTTLVGPQRDDFSFYKRNNEKERDEGRDVSRFGSRGEQRLAVLWLKLSELEFIEKQTGARPILLLDDIFSELDQHSKKLVLSIINKQQTMITSADDEILALWPKGGVQIIKLPIST